MKNFAGKIKWMKACDKISKHFPDEIGFPSLIWKKVDGGQRAKLGNWVIELSEDGTKFNIKTRDIACLKSAVWPTAAEAKAWAAYWCLSEIRKMERQLMMEGYPIEYEKCPNCFNKHWPQCDYKGPAPLGGMK